MEFPITSIKTLEGLQSIFDGEVKNLDEFTGNELLARIFGTILLYNNLDSKQKIGILDRIVKYLKELKGKLDSISEEWGINDYSISVDVPFGISVSLNFEPKKN